MELFDFTCFFGKSWKIIWLRYKNPNRVKFRLDGLYPRVKSFCFSFLGFVWLKKFDCSLQSFRVFLPSISQKHLHVIQEKKCIKKVNRRWDDSWSMFCLYDKHQKWDLEILLGWSSAVPDRSWGGLDGNELAGTEGLWVFDLKEQTADEYCMNSPQEK